MKAHLKLAHHYIFYIGFILVLFIAVRALIGIITQKRFLSEDKDMILISTIVLHVQLLIGIILYLSSPILEKGIQDFAAVMKNSSQRFFLLEHPLGMILAIILVTIGRSKSQKSTIRSKRKYRIIFLLYLIAFIVMAASVPWNKIFRF